MVAWELASGRRVRLWQDEFPASPPYSIGSDSLFVAFAASAEFSCSLVLGWPRPVAVLDPYVEFRQLSNGVTPPGDVKLLNVLPAYGIQAIPEADKDYWRKLVLRGGPWSREERQGILDYCETDVDVTSKLLEAMLPEIDLPRALLRGRYMHAVACMEHVGVPVDMPLWHRLQQRWDSIKAELIAEVDATYGVYVDGSFNTRKFVEYLNKEGIPWPVLKSGDLELTDKVFDKMSDSFPQLRQLHYLRNALDKLKLSSFTVGRDGFNRAWLRPFWTITGRNNPSPAEFIFGAASWLRGLVKPPPGFGICYIDWVQQEFAIAAAMSGDSAKMVAYVSGDSYLWLAKETNAVPVDATKETHELEREQFKQCTLGTQYGMQSRSLALRIGKSEAVSRRLLRADRETYHEYWKWLNDARNCAFINARQESVFGWRKRITEASDNPRSAGNFFSQANGAEMMRLAAILGTEAGIQICAPMHDAFLIMAPLERLDMDTEAMRGFMGTASELVLEGFRLRTEAKPFRYPERYTCKKGAEMWEKVMKLL